MQILFRGNNTHEIVAISVQDHDGRTMAMRYNYLNICNWRQRWIWNIMQICLTTRLYSPFTFEPSYHNFSYSFTVDTSNLWILGTMMRKPIKTTEYRKMPAVRGFYGFKRKTLWRRYRFSLPFFFFFILFIVHAARGRIGKYNKTWSVSLLLLLARIAWIKNAMFAIQDDASLQKKDVLD